MDLKCLPSDQRIRLGKLVLSDQIPQLKRLNSPDAVERTPEHTVLTISRIQELVKQAPNVAP
jgi:hypothetical protein